MGGKIEYTDDILAPQEEIYIEFDGKNPFLAMAISPGLLKDIFRLAATGMYHDDIRWDVSGGDNKSFYAVYRTKRTEDKWTKFFTKVIIQGTKDRENFGHVEIRIRAWLETSFKYSTPLHRTFWRLFNYFFYWKQRRAYMDFTRDLVLRFREELLAAYNILREETGRL